MQSFRGLGLFALLFATWLASLVAAVQANGLLAWMSGVLYIAYDTALQVFGWCNAPPRAVAGTEAPSRKHTDAQPRLAILIAARNEGAVLARTLDALLPQCGAEDVVVIADDGSTDGTAALLQRHYGLLASGDGLRVSSRHPALRWHPAAHAGKAATLNRVWPLVSADVVVTVDADTLLFPGALAAVRRAFAEDASLCAACGVLTPVARRTGAGFAFDFFQRLEYLRAFLIRAAWARHDALLLVSGAFAAYRREALEAVGGLDARSLVEDYELIHRLRRHAGDAGLRWMVRVLPEARALTDAPHGILGFLRQRRRWFAGFLHTQFAYRRMHGDARYGGVGRLMLPVKAVDTLQPLYGLTAFALLLHFLASGSTLLLPVLVLLGSKLLLDLFFHTWAAYRYHAWLGQPAPRGLWAQALLAALLEPFSFQLLRHAGAAWGWWLFLRGRQDWVAQRPTTS